MVNLFGKKPPMPVSNQYAKTLNSRNMGQKGPHGAAGRYAYQNKKYGSFDVIDEERFKLEEMPNKGALSKAAENIMNMDNKGRGRNQMGTGAMTPDHLHA